MTKHRIIIGDSRDMHELDMGEVHLAVTSPPYVTSKFKRGQPFDYEDYLNTVRGVFKEVYRVLCEDGRFCLNVGDVHTKYYYKTHERFYRLPVSSDLLQICLNQGFRLLDTFIWDKGFNRHKGGMPGPLFGSYPYPATIFNNTYWEYVHVLIKPGKPRKVPKEVKEKSKLSQEKWRDYVQKIWRVESESEWVKEHPSVFPLQIPERYILMYSFVGDNVLDPFLGSGTTTLAARITGRNSIGYEINPKYLDLIKRRSKMSETTLTGERDEFTIEIRDDTQKSEWT